MCPACRGPLTARPGTYACGACIRAYPVLDGIPDFRVFPDPYLDVEEDRRRAVKVLEAMDRHDLRGLLEYYWSLSDITPPDLRQVFIRGALQGEAKARRLLRVLEEGAPPGSEPPRSLLEVGSGTGALLVAAAGHVPRIVGVDIAMRWLHLSRRRFLDHGRAVPTLVCACAERLPFPDGFFDVVVSAATLEMTRDPGQALAESARVLARDGAALVNTGNRFSLALEPHVQLWGVGFLPRPWQVAWVRWRRGVDFSKIRSLSLGELDHLAAPHFRKRRIAPADAADETVAALPPLRRAKVALYRGLRRVRALRPLLLRVAPEWDVRLEKEVIGSPLVHPGR